MSEIGLTGLNSAYINCLTPVIGMLTAPLAGTIAHKFNKYQTLLVISLLGSTICYTSLLFIPRVIMNPRHPQIMFDCTNNQLKMEMCRDWNGQCSKPKKLAVGNYTNFELTRCNFICPSSSPFNSSWYPMSVCFVSSSEKKLCLLHDPELADRGSGWTKDSGQGFESGSEQLIQFDSRFDRWPVTEYAEVGMNKDCVYQAVAPLLVNHKPYETIQCRPFIQNCYVHCKVNMMHRPRNAPKSRSKPPDPCYDIIGDPVITFYAYLVARSAAEMFAFTAYNLLDALSVTLENNFDTLFGGLAKVLSTSLPLMIFPIVTGILIDYYSLLANQADYSPSFILYDGVVLIASALVIAAPVAPLVTSESTLSTSGPTFASNTSLRSTPSLRALKTRIKIPRENWYIFCSTVIPLTLVSGIIWSILQVHLYPFYLQIGYNKIWISSGFVMIFAFYTPFCMLGKKLVTGIGRLHLVLVGLLFYSLRLSGISLLSRVSWMLLPLEAMEAFTLPITWIGVTSYSHHLITTSVRPELMQRLGVDRATSTHLKMQYFLNFLHFGLGKVVGCGIWAIWLIHWKKETVNWNWLNLDDADLPEIDSNGFRIWLRLTAVICATISLAALFFSHIFGAIVNYLISLGKEIILCINICKKRCFNCLSQACCCQCTCKLPRCNICKTKKRKRGKRGRKKNKKDKKRTSSEEEREDEEDYYGICGGTNATISTSLTNNTDHPGANYARLMENHSSLSHCNTHDQHGHVKIAALPNGNSKLNHDLRPSSTQSLTSLELLPKRVSNHRRQSASEATQTIVPEQETTYYMHPVDTHHHHHHHKRVVIGGITEEDESLLDGH